MKVTTGDRSKLSRGVHQLCVQPLANPSDRKGCWVLPKEIIASTDWLRGLWEQRERISDKPAPILWGLRDSAFRERELQTWQHLFTDGQVHRLEGAGHSVQEECRQEVVRIVAK